MNTLKNPEQRAYGDIITINVDVQNDFALPTGKLSVNEGETVVEPLNDINDWTRANGGLVVFTADNHPEQTAHFAAYGGVWPEHCVAGTPGAELHNNLIKTPEDLIAYKGTGTIDDGYSGTEAKPVYPGFPDSQKTVGDIVTGVEHFTDASRERLLVLVGGLATDYCVKATVLDALELTDRKKTDVILLRDAIRAVNINPTDGDEAIKAMLEAGALAMTTEEILRGGVQIDASRLER